MKQYTQEQAAVLEANLRGMNWKMLVKQLMECVERFHHATELPPTIRRWLDLPRTPPNEEEMAKFQSELKLLLESMEADPSQTGDWLTAQTETSPISGWVINACHFLKDGKRWWLFAAKRHDDSAPLVGPTVPAPASAGDLRRLGKVIAYAGGNPKRELLRTGAITQEEHDRLMAEGKDEIANYGEIFFWWAA